MFKFVVCLFSLMTAFVAAETNVLAFAGSLQTESVNKKLVIESAKIAQKLGAKVTVVDLSDYQIPLYNADLEKQSGMPPKAKQLRDLMLANQVILIASPEYNGSLSAALKNVIDWVSRSEEGQGSRQAFIGKKFVIMSASPSPKGGEKGLLHLRQIIEHIGGQVIDEQFALGDAYNAFDDQGQLKDKAKQIELEQMIKKVVD